MDQETLDRINRKPTHAKNLHMTVISEERQARVATMFLQGSSMRQIGREIGVSVHTVSKDLMRARKEWKSEAAKTYEERLPEKLAELNAIRAAAWEGWKRSLRPESIISKESNETKDGNFERRGRKRKTTAGDPRFLQRLESILRTECQILGMLDSDVTENNSVTVNAVEIVINNAKEKEQFEKIYSLEEFQKQTKPA
jgi:DNA-binding CsgD family transcriptional regulator